MMTRTFLLTCWNCKRENIPLVVKISDDPVPVATTTVQHPCPFCQKLMSVDVPLNLPSEDVTIKQLPSKQA